MSSTTPSGLTSADCAALLAKALNGVQPALVKDSAQVRLAPWRPHLIKCRQEGYSMQQLVSCLATPEIGITVSEAVLRKFLRGATRKKAAAKKKPAEVNAPAAATAS